MFVANSISLFLSSSLSVSRDTRAYTHTRTHTHTHTHTLSLSLSLSLSLVTQLTRTKASHEHVHCTDHVCIGLEEHAVHGGPQRQVFVGFANHTGRRLGFDRHLQFLALSDVFLQSFFFLLLQFFCEWLFSWWFLTTLQGF